MAIVSHNYQDGKIGDQLTYVRKQRVSSSAHAPLFSIHSLANKTKHPQKKRWLKPVERVKFVADSGEGEKTLRPLAEDKRNTIFVYEKICKFPLRLD